MNLFVILVMFVWNKFGFKVLIGLKFKQLYIRTKQVNYLRNLAWKILLKFAIQKGCFLIGMGHYLKIVNSCLYRSSLSFAPADPGSIAAGETLLSSIILLSSLSFTFTLRNSILHH